MLLSIGAGSACSDSSYSTGPVELPPLPAFDGQLTFVDTMSVDRHDRTALVVLPSSYDHETRIPILFAYHGSGGSASQMRTQTRLDPIANEFGFAVVYLDAYDGFWVTPCADCDNEGRDPREEIDYAHDLIRSLSRSHALDPQSVYATGFSMGGFFLNHVGCLSDLPFLGIAPVAAGARRTMPASCVSSFSRRPIMVQITNGMVDLSVPPEGGDTWLGVDELASWWRDWNGCEATSSGSLEPVVADESAPQIVRTDWSACTAGSQVQVQKVERIGHWWLTEDNNPSHVDYGRTLVSFFGLGS